MCVIQPIIMAGGSGTRLWPVSRASCPKQFIKIFGGKSLLQLTLERNRSFAKPVVIAGEEHKLLALEQIRELGIEADIILEPVSRNTATCAVIAALYAKKNGADVALLLPSDHHIETEAKYISSVESAVTNGEYIVTFGIKPNSAHTGYGYIHAGDRLRNNMFHVKQFVEKPSIEKAEKYIRDGGYYWNSGIFAFAPDLMLDIAKNLEPAIYEASCCALEIANYDREFITLNSDSYKLIKGNSIDYAFIEKTSMVAMAKADFGWRDMGSWNALWEVYDKDETGNSIYGDVELCDTSNSYIHSDGRLTAVIGLKDLIIVNTPDASLIAHKSRAEDVKHMVEKLLLKKREEVLKHVV